MANLIVDTLADTVDDTDGVLSLREALIISNGNMESDSITFAAGLTGTIALNDTLVIDIGDGNLTTVNGDTDGDGIGDITLDGGYTYRILDVTSGSYAALTALSLNRGYDRGSYGTNGSYGSFGDTGTQGAEGTYAPDFYTPGGDGGAGGAGGDGLNGGDGTGGDNAAGGIYNAGILTLNRVELGSNYAFGGVGGAGGAGGAGGVGGSGGYGGAARTSSYYYNSYDPEVPGQFRYYGYENGGAGGAGGDGGNGGSGGTGGAGGLAGGDILNTGTLVLNDVSFGDSSSYGRVGGGRGGYGGSYGSGGSGGSGGGGGYGGYGAYGGDGGDGGNGGTAGTSGMGGNGGAAATAILNLGTISAIGNATVAGADTGYAYTGPGGTGGFEGTTSPGGYGGAGGLGDINRPGGYSPLGGRGDDGLNGQPGAPTVQGGNDGADGQAVVGILSIDGGTTSAPISSVDTLIFLVNEEELSIVEGNAGTTDVSLTVGRLGDTSGATNFTYVISDNTGNATQIDADDFVGSLTGSGSFAAGESSTTITLQIVGDTTAELDEFFRIDLATADADTGVGTSYAYGSIVTDDAPVLSFYNRGSGFDDQSGSYLTLQDAVDAVGRYSDNLEVVAGEPFSLTGDQGVVELPASGSYGVTDFSVRASSEVTAEFRFLDDPEGDSGGSLTLIGTTNADITGNSGDNTLTGSDGDNTLIGNGGMDTLVGGNGNDLYVIDSLDTVSEAGTGGRDTVLSDASVNLLDGRFTGTIDVVSVTQSAGAAQLFGNGIANILNGNGSANRLDGRAGADIMRGRGGDDIYVVDNVGDIVDETGGSGFDRVLTSLTLDLAGPRVLGNVEAANLQGTGDLDLFGNGLQNALVGNDGANRLDGRGDRDTMRGGNGNDTYVIDNVLDRVLEDGTNGFDRVLSTVNVDLANGFRFSGDVEAASLTLGAGDANLFGNGLDNILIGSGGNNRLDGRGGADTMRGGQGNDVYVWETGDTIDELSFNANGRDRVISGETVNLTDIATFQGAVEDVTLSGSGTVNAFGNGLSNTLQGNGGANRLNGFDGLDTLRGFGGNDVLNGGARNDTLTGDGGADTFVFSDALANNNIDRVTDFTSGVDTLALDDAVFTGLAAGALSADAFHVAGTAGFDADVRIVYNAGNGVLSYDADGSGAGAAQVFAVLSSTPTIDETDFLIV